MGYICCRDDVAVGNDPRLRHARPAKATGSVRDDHVHGRDRAAAPEFPLVPSIGRGLLVRPDSG